MMDRYQVLTHHDLLDKGTQDLLLFSGSQVLRGLVETAKKTFHRVAQLDPALVLHGAQLEILLLLLQRADLFPHLWRALS